MHPGHRRQPEAALCHRRRYVGMEGNGPIMGTPKQAGVLVMGLNLAAIDATSACLMRIDPFSVTYLAAAAGRLGPLAVADIEQRGEVVIAARTDFLLTKTIPAQRLLRT